MDRQSVLSLPEDQRREKLYEGARGVEGSLLAELFDANGERVYLYDIYGYEHSSIFISREKVSENDLGEVLKQYHCDQHRAERIHREWTNRPEISALYDQDPIDFDEINRREEADGIDARVEETRGADIHERLFDRFGMLRIACQERVFEDAWLTESSCD